MPKHTEKSSLLDNAGYAYNFDRMMYVNRRDKKAFSVEFIEDHPESEIQSHIQESTDGSDWRFYTNWPIAEGIERELKRVLG
jgi:hypothetical protein